MNDNAKLLLADFIAQAVCGTNIALFRAARITYDDAGSNPMRFGFLAKYLNDTWKSMILKDDPFITNTFDEIHAIIPDESPLCVMHKCFNIGQSLILNPPVIGSSSPPAMRTPENEAYVDTLRTMLTNIYKSGAKNKLDELDNVAGSHSCSGPKYATLHQTENPNEPIFDVRM